MLYIAALVFEAHFCGLGRLLIRTYRRLSSCKRMKVINFLMDRPNVNNNTLRRFLLIVSYSFVFS